MPCKKEKTKGLLFYLHFMGFALIGLFLLFLFFWINIQSQHLVNKVASLTQSLREMTNIKSEPNVTLRGQEMSAQEARDLIVRRLSQYKGFDGYEYFHLGKGLLTSILSHVTTYLIIIIQFGISEI